MDIIFNKSTMNILLYLDRALDIYEVEIIIVLLNTQLFNIFLD